MAQQRFDASWTPMYAGNDGWPATAPVGRYPKGASPFGVWIWRGTFGNGPLMPFPTTARSPQLTHNKLAPTTRLA